MIYNQVGPALPRYQGKVSLKFRYTAEMLSKPRPEFVEPQNNSCISILDLNDPSSSTVQRFIENVERPLRPTKQGKGTAIGFFEQGILVGMVFIALPAVSCIGYSGWYLIRMMARRYF